VEWLGRCWTAVVGALVVGLLACAPAEAISGVEIVQRLNAQRQANGLPAELIERADWSNACAAHDRYEAQTGEFGHHENPESPYFTEEGNWAGEHSVLAWGSSWADGNPWEDAPIHLIQMLAPALAEMGADESGGQDCATTWPGYTRADPPNVTAYSYPGNGVSGVVPAESAGESPFIPGDFVGLPEGTETGRYLLAFLDGPPPAESAEVATATLTGPSGPVELRVVDSSSPEIGPYMPPSSAFLIPVKPLQPLTTYGAVVSWAESGAPILEQRFSFATGQDAAKPTAISGESGSTRVCRRQAQQASVLRRRAARVRARAFRLSRGNASMVDQLRARRLRARSRTLMRKASAIARQARSCTGSSTASK
jgi:hypothetical protein